MVWPFKVSHSLTFSKCIKTSPNAVLRFLHDPEMLFTLNPLIINTANDPSDTKRWTITDRLVLFGWIDTTTTYTAVISHREDGLLTETQASAGTSLKSSWVVSGENDATLVVEQVTVQAFFFLMPLILGALKQSHLASLEKLASRLEQASSPSTSPAFLFQHYCPLSKYNTLALVLASLVLAMILNHVSADPYDLYHISLNEIPGASTPPPTEWLNMGYWKDTTVFPEACRALAMKLISAARYERDNCVLDVGHGTGESLLLLLADPSVPRPSKLVGITSLSSHHRRSKDRIARLQRLQDPPNPDVHLYLGDAVYRPGDGVPDHPLAPSSSTVFDRILALDCAYHFETRRVFLEQSFRKLAPRGRIALADICFAPGVLGTCRTRFATSLLRLMPKANMISTENYILQMQAIGFTDVELEDITEDVFPSFIQFMIQRGWGWCIFGIVLRWYVRAGARFIIVSGFKSV